MIGLIHHVDCLRFDPDPYDVLITDPPYAPNVHANATSCSSRRADGKQVMGARHRDLGFEHLTPGLMWRTCTFAASAARWSIIYSDLESVGAWRDMLERAGTIYVRTIPWVRWSMPQLSGDRPPQGAEAIIVAHASTKIGKKHWNGPGNLTHFDETCLRGEGKHKTEKPLDQLLRLVSYFSDPGEIVFDPMAGSGTTCLAAKLLGRQFIGCELDGEWCDRANARVNNLLSDRDQRRHTMFEARMIEETKDRERITNATAKVRLKPKRDALETCPEIPHRVGSSHGNPDDSGQ